MAEMSTRGLESALFCLEEGADLLPDEEVFPYAWPDSALRRRLDFHHRHPPLADALQRCLERVQPDLVHVQNWGVFRSTVFPLLARAPCPVVMTVHDFTLLDPNPWGLERSGWSGPLRRWMDHRSLSKARGLVFSAVDHFLCPSEVLRTTIPFPAGRARLHRLPIPPAAAAPPPAPGDPLRLFFAGTLYRSKGVDLLLEALALAPATIQLELAGQGDQEAALRQQAEALGLGTRVRFLGQLDADGMAAAYERCHLVVLPSRVPENSPLILLEAGARGRPGLASHSGGSPELLAPPERGWTFPPEDPAALGRILDGLAAEPTQTERRGAAMRDWVRRSCDPRAHWDALESLYHEICP